MGDTQVRGLDGSLGLGASRVSPKGLLLRGDEFESRLHRNSPIRNKPESPLRVEHGPHRGPKGVDSKAPQSGGRWPPSSGWWRAWLDRDGQGPLSPGCCGGLPPALQPASPDRAPWLRAAEVETAMHGQASALPWSLLDRATQSTGPAASPLAVQAFICTVCT